MPQPMPALRVDIGLKVTRCLVSSLCGFEEEDPGLELEYTHVWLPSPAKEHWVCGTGQPEFLCLIFWNQIRLVNRPVACSSISQPSLGTGPDFLGLPQRCLLFTEQTSSRNQPHSSNVTGQRGGGKITGIRGHLGSFRIELFSEQPINPVALKRASVVPAPPCIKGDWGLGRLLLNDFVGSAGAQWGIFYGRRRWGLSPAQSYRSAFRRGRSLC